MAKRSDINMSLSLASNATTTEHTDPLAASRALRLTLDLVERALVLTWYSYFVWRLLPANDESWISASWLMIVSESLVIFLILIRRPAKSVSLRFTDWLIAVTATLLPLSITPAANPQGLIPPTVCVVLMIAGLIIQIRAKISLGRSVGMVPADRGIKRLGPYQIVRHPMYAGYLFSCIGFLLLHPTAWNISIYAVAFAVQVVRLFAEERFLSQNEEYRSYMGVVRYRLIPGVF
jgi:protein-S-isoprenylcysteine O-methyltransferase Ste14